MKKIFEKYPVFLYIIGSYVKFFLFLLAFITVMFAVLEFTGIYARLERVLDLKYNSPYVLLPLYGFAVLALLCFVTGLMLYLYKYKRSKTKTAFSIVFSNILNEKQTDH